MKGIFVVIGGPPHFSRQEFLCSSRNIPKRIGKEKHEKTTVDLPIFDQASFCPARNIGILSTSEANWRLSRHVLFKSTWRDKRRFSILLVVCVKLGVEFFLRSILCVDHHRAPHPPLLCSFLTHRMSSHACGTTCRCVPEALFLH